MVGGLGNQLFIAAAAAAHMTRMGASFTLLDDRYRARSIRDGGSHRFSSDLRQLSLPENLEIVAPEDWVYSPISDMLAGISSHSGPFRSLLGRYFYTSSVLGYDSELLQVRPVYVRGYFQSFRYLEILLNNRIQFNLEPLRPTTIFMEAKSQLMQEGPFGVLHVRRGDYRKNTEKFGLLDSDYYFRALNAARERSGIDRFLVFSDENSDSWEPELRDLVETENLQIFETGDLHPHEVLRIMSCGSVFCIANSSFSWWAASLAKDALVVFPDKWFRDMADPAELTPPSWLPIESSWIHP